MAGFLVAQGIAHIDARTDGMGFNQPQDGLALAGAGVAEAQVALHPGGQTQLPDAKLGIAALGIADDEDSVLFAQSFDGLPNLGIADLAFVFMEVAVLRVHAPLQQIIPFRYGNGCEEDIGNVRHHLAEEGLQGFRIHKQMLQALLLQLGIVALGNQCPGIPQSAVNVKNNAFVIHTFTSSRCRWMRPMIISSAT